MDVDTVDQHLKDVQCFTAGCILVKVTDSCDSRSPVQLRISHGKIEMCVIFVVFFFTFLILVSSASYRKQQAPNSRCWTRERADAARRPNDAGWQ